MFLATGRSRSGNEARRTRDEREEERAGYQLVSCHALLMCKWFPRMLLKYNPTACLMRAHSPRWYASRR